MEIDIAYANIEEIITKGFLSELVEYENIKIVLKNLTDKEFVMLPYYSGRNSELNIFYKLAFATYMINGVNYLVKRSDLIEELADFYKNVPAPFLSVLLEILEDVHLNYLETVNFFEGFCYTTKSRSLWRSLSNNLFVINPYGIEGITSIGINSIQENWTIINKQLDVEDTYEQNFNLALLVASAFNGKGAKKIANNHESHKKDIEEYRETLSQYGYDQRRKEEEKKREWAPSLKTREDLVVELEKQMRGERDKHDLFMEDWYKKQRQKAEDARKAAIEKQRSFTKKFDESILDLEPSRTATDEEIKKISKPIKNPGASTSHEAFRKKDDEERFLSKMSARVIKAKDIED
jgi:hypothetical protein